MKKRFWRFVDRALKKVGLIRAQLVPRIEVMERDKAPRYIRIEFPNGYRVSGYLDSRFSGIVKYGDNPNVMIR